MIPIIKRLCRSLYANPKNTPIVQIIKIVVVKGWPQDLCGLSKVGSEIRSFTNETYVNNQTITAIKVAKENSISKVPIQINIKPKVDENSNAKMGVPPLLICVPFLMK